MALSMSNGKSKSAKIKTPTVVTAPATKPAAAPTGHTPPLFRRIDWLALLITFAIVWTTYFLTLAPELTLEDSGELCTGAYYAGIPHPPGYPFWAIYSWLWTTLLPVGNVAWRVEVGEATAAAMACGLVAFMVSRGSSMLMEGIEDLRSMTGKWENAICLVSGTVAGLLLGFDGVMWSESVAINRISLFGVPWVMIVLLCLLRWIYAPHQRRYLYCAMFFFGICATIHQTLLVAAMAIEAAIAAAQPRLGRDLFLGNSIVYALGLIAKSTHFTTMLDTAPMVLLLFHAVGLGSIAVWIWLTIKTKSLGTEWKAVIFMGLLWLAGASFYFYEAISGMSNPPMQWGYPRTVDGFYHALSRGQYEKANPTDLLSPDGRYRFLMQLGMLVGGLAEEYNWVLVLVALLPFLFFLKMQRRERSWIIGLTAIYFCIGVLLMILMNTSPDRQSADLNKVFFAASHGVFAIMMGYGVALIAAFMATHYQKFRRWGVLGGALAIVPAAISVYAFNVGEFFGRGGISYPLTLELFIYLLLACVGAAVGLYMLAGGQRPKGEGLPLFVGVLASCAACVFVGLAVKLTFFGEGAKASSSQLFSLVSQCFTNKDQYGLPVYAGLLLLSLPVVFLLSLAVYRNRAPLVITLGLFAVMPLCSGLSHWGNSEQRNHWFGYWFGHDMFTPPFKGPGGKLGYDAKLREQAMKGTNGSMIYPEMTKDTILFGGTDPGRFCPTYMVFCESFIPHDCQPAMDQKFDRRDVYIITQNALADGTYLQYIRAHYNRSTQIDPPFFSELARRILKDKEYETNLLARLVSPFDTFFTNLGDRIEKRRRTSTSLFTDNDFTDLPAFAAKLRQAQDPFSKYVLENLSAETQKLLSDKASEPLLRRSLAKDLNRLLERELQINELKAGKTAEKDAIDEDLAGGNTSERKRQRSQELAKEIADLSKIGPLYEPERFKQTALSEYLTDFIRQNPQSHTRIRLNRLLLEAAYPGEIAKSIGGVYPDREIHTPLPTDLERCFSEYIADAQRRLQLNQLKPGEDVRYDRESGRASVSGNVAVMGINGLLTKDIFDKNPKNDFYVEESFPLDWMYPYLTPYGIIMKINRNPLPTLTEDILQRDHEFWTQFSERLIGNWINYDTSVKEIVAFIERVYLRRDFTGFKGDRKFIRDDQAQKSFSKLRSAIANSVYRWRIDPRQACPPQYRPKSDAESQAILREAEFASRQAFAFCPYSPEAVFHYADLLTLLGRWDDAILVAETCVKLDPYNPAAIGLLNNLRATKKQIGEVDQARANLLGMEEEVRKNPTNFQAAFSLAGVYLQNRQTNQAAATLDQVLSNPAVNPAAVRFVAQAYARDIRDYSKVEAALERLVKVAPDDPEAWFDLAGFKAAVGKAPEALPALRRALELNAKRLQQNPGAPSLLTNLQTDARFTSLRPLPEFQQLLAPK
jgi:tetratricopeptide (TPR) repeat protein